MFLTAARICTKLLLAQTILFAANTNLGHHIFTYVNKKFTNVFVRAFLKPDDMRLPLVNPTTD